MGEGAQRAAAGLTCVFFFFFLDDSSISPGLKSPADPPAGLENKGKREVLALAEEVVYRWLVGGGGASDSHFGCQGKEQKRERRRRSW